MCMLIRNHLTLVPTEGYCTLLNKTYGTSRGTYFRYRYLPRYGVGTKVTIPDVDGEVFLAPPVEQHVEMVVESLGIRDALPVTALLVLKPTVKICQYSRYRWYAVRYLPSIPNVVCTGTCTKK